MRDPAPAPLTPAELDALLRPDPRTRAADLLVLRDALQRMAEALEQLSAAVQELQGPAAPVPPARPPAAERAVDLSRHRGLGDIAAPDATSPPAPPAADRAPDQPDAPPGG